MILVPALVLARVPTLAAVGASQAVGLLVATFATAGFVLFGDVDPVPGTALGAVAGVGTAAGARVAHALPVATLRKATAATCVGTGTLMLVAALH